MCDDWELIPHTIHTPTIHINSFSYTRLALFLLIILRTEWKYPDKYMWVCIYENLVLLPWKWTKRKIRGKKTRNKGKIFNVCRKWEKKEKITIGRCGGDMVVVSIVGWVRMKRMRAKNYFCKVFLGLSESGFCEGIGRIAKEAHDIGLSCYWELVVLFELTVLNWFPLGFTFQFQVWILNRFSSFFWMSER